MARRGPVFLRNVRFLAAGRRLAFIDEDAVVKVAEAGAAGMTYTWMRCQLVHEAALPPDLWVDHHFADSSSLSIRAGGPPEHTVLISPAWLQHLADQTRRRAGKRTGGQ